MISVAEALESLSHLVAPLDTEPVSLINANGRVLARPAISKRDQPPFAASSMDGYAVSVDDLSTGKTSWKVIGESAAGHRFSDALNSGQAVRIFTGAPLPDGADHVLIQENVQRHGDEIALIQTNNSKPFVRPKGYDFESGFTLDAGQRLTPQSIALLASMNVDQVWVTRKPTIALIATGDELVSPGENPGMDQIIASNSYGLYAMLEQAGAAPRLLPIARDRIRSLQLVYEKARDADLIITIGGASVGDHDLVAKVAIDMGLQQSFYKVAMRPGKPLMAGTMAGSAMIGLPGNPVSAMVCGEVFVKPMIDKMLGLPFCERQRLQIPLAHDLAANGPREHYMRAIIQDGALQCDFPQDSALLSILHSANALCVRAPQDGSRHAGDMVDYIPL